MLDHPTYNIAQHFDATFFDIDEGLKRGNVYVHCAAGISRSVSCVLAYLMKKFGMNYVTAYNTLKKKRKIIQPNPGFAR